MDITSFQNYFLFLNKITQYFSLPDYLILISIFLVILLFFLLSIILRFNLILGFLMLFISGAFFVASPFIYQYIMESHLKKIELTLSNNDKLQYDDTYYIKGTIKNIGYFDLKGCIISTNFIPQNTDKFNLIRYKIKPIFTHRETYKQPLKKQETLDFEILFQAPSTINTDIKYILETKGSCY